MKSRKIHIHWSKHILAILLWVLASAVIFQENVSADTLGTTGDMDTISTQSSSSLPTRAFELKGVTISAQNANHYETSHFNFYWGNSGNASKVTLAYLKEAGTLMEQVWQVYIGEMKMTPPLYAINKPYDQQQPYKLNVLLADTGLSGVQNAWAYADRDSQTYPYFAAQVAALEPSKDWWGSGVPHEFGHDVQFAQGNNSWNDGKYLQPWYETVANWFREEYAYSDVYRNSGNNLGTSLSEMYLRATMLTPVNGRAFYEAWPLLLFLQHNPDHLNISSNLMKKLLTNGDKTNSHETFFKILRKNTPRVSQKTLFGDYASRIASLEWAGNDSQPYSPKTLYSIALNSLFKQHNLYWQQFYTQMEKVNHTSNTFRVPNERTPQANAFNIIKLQPKFKHKQNQTKLTVSLKGLTKKHGADWRARLIVQPGNGASARYSKLFRSNGSKSISVKQTDDVYLSVAATPDKKNVDVNTFGLSIDSKQFSEKAHPYNSKARYPYQVTLKNATPASRPQTSLKGVSGYYTKDGGFVANTASVGKDVTVGKGAAILDHAKVKDHAVITGHAVVKDHADVSGDAHISGHALVEGNASVEDHASVRDYGIVDQYGKLTGHAIVDEMAIVKDHAHIGNDAKATDSALAQGYYSVLDHAQLGGMSIGGGGSPKAISGLAGNAKSYGDFFDDSGYQVQSGKLSRYESVSTSLDQYKDGYIKPTDAVKNS